ncbi:hypothetical protein B566_EDAN002123 [Ephemera danica]|nr:hypothetical protein B566_EDAN002123 [Ephemera danica]
MQFTISSDTLLAVAVVVILYWLNSKKIYAFRQWLFAKHMKLVGDHADQALRDMKVKPAHVADPLRELVSFDPELRKKKQLRIVEVGVGCDMHEIPDGSVDAVVTQYALCSCHEVLQIMKEIKRILAPIAGLITAGVNGACPSVCTAQYQPICGRNSAGETKTFSNPCILEVHNCNQQADFAKIRNGEC